MPSETQIGIPDILDACDLLADRLEQYRDQLAAEHPTALDRGDPRFIYRVERGMTWAQELLDLIDDDLLDRIGSLRHNDHQLKWARQGKIV